MLAATLLPVLSLLLPFARAAAIQPRSVNLGWPYGQEKIRGVNLGGWLVLEPFITPSLFEATGNDGIVDEYTFGQYQDRNVASAALRAHWDTWITEDDFAQIAAAGLNHVRLPVGYWAYDVSAGEPYIQGQAEYVDRAIGWARNHGLKVMIDLHGAPGSQNGFDNSGRRGSAQWPYDNNNLIRTKNILEQLSRKYSDPSYFQTVTALAILNEPATFMSQQFLDTTRQFNYDAYGATRYPWASQGDGSKSGLAIVVHDGFQPVSYFDNYLNEPNYESIILDHHEYTVFSDAENRLNDQDRLNRICSRAGEFSGSQLWFVVGEWSLASTDCARWLNGRGIGSRYDGSYAGSSYIGSCDVKSGDGSNFSDEYKTYLRKFWDTQTQVYENNGQGWIMWAWKMESAAEWSYQAGLAGGWIPRDPTAHQNGLDQLCT